MILINNNSRIAIAATLGLVPLWPFCRANYFGKILSDFSSSRTAALFVYLIFIVCVLVFCLYMIRKSESPRNRLKEKGYILGVGVGGLAGCCLILTAPSAGDFSTAVLIVGTILWAIETLILVVFWMKILNTIPMEMMLKSTALSLLLSFMLMYLIGRMPDDDASLVRASYTSVSVIFCWIALTWEGKKGPVIKKQIEREIKQGMSLLVTFLLIGTIVKGYYYAEGTIGFSDFDLYVYRFTASLLSTAIVIMSFITKGTLHYLILLRLVVISIFVIGFVFLLVLPPEYAFAAEAVAIASREFINYLLVISVLLLIQAKSIPEPKAFGLYIFVQAISGVLPYYILPLMVEIVGLDIKWVIGLCVIVIAAVTSVHFYKLIFREQSERRPINRNREEACAAIQKKYQLTERETEVLVQLSQGQTRKAIAKNLYVTDNTVAAHTKAIYTKTERHKKDEVIALVKETMMET